MKYVENELKTDLHFDILLKIHLCLRIIEYQQQENKLCTSNELKKINKALLKLIPEKNSDVYSGL